MPARAGTLFRWQDYDLICDLICATSPTAVGAVLRDRRFGAGLYFCVGAPLARLELQTALPILFARLPRLALTAPPRYANLCHFHGLERLMVTR